MISMLCSLWDDFRKWVTVSWTDTTFALVMSTIGILGLLALLSFFKEAFGKGKETVKSIRWGSLILALILFAILAVLSAAKFTKI